MVAEIGRQWTRNDDKKRQDRDSGPSMRLTCPNCRAQYEVDDSAIPARGRDVQCSSCGHGWFERPVAAGDAVATSVPPRTPPPDTPTRDTDLDAVPSDAPEPAPPPGMIPQGPRLAPKRALDPAIAEVLRAEAAREANRRRQESAELLEEQQEFSLTPGAMPPTGDAGAAIPADAASGSVTDSVPDPVPDPPEDAHTPDGPEAPSQTDTPLPKATTAPPRFSEATREQVPRRDLLPDIEEINSSLRAKGVGGTDARKMYTPEQSHEYKRQGRGFRLGFSVVLILATACVLIYGFAPKIAAIAPGLAPSLEVYVAEVNAARAWINGQLVSGTEAFTAFLMRITS